MIKAGPLLNHTIFFALLFSQSIQNDISFLLFAAIRQFMMKFVSVHILEYRGSIQYSMLSFHLSILNLST